MEQLAINIKRLRKEKGLTQQELAEVINMHRSNYSKVESGERELSVTSLIKLASFFDISLDALVSEENPRPKEVIVKNKSLIEQVALIEELNEDDKNIVLKMIEALLTKKRFKSFFEQNLAS